MLPAAAAAGHRLHRISSNVRDADEVTAALAKCPHQAAAQRSCKICLKTLSSAGDSAQGANRLLMTGLQIVVLLA